MGNRIRGVGIFILSLAAAPVVLTQVAQQPATIFNTPAQLQKIAGPNEPPIVFHKNVEEVVLHTIVSDQKHRTITDLNVSDFTILENGIPQLIKSFTNEDMPVALGIIIDGSASMLGKSRAVKEAALDLIRASNPDDEIFVAHFNQEYHLDQDFTSDVSKLRSTLEGIGFQGQTALYDAIVAAAAHLCDNEDLGKRVLVIVTDGEDNFSNYSLSEAIQRVELNGGPVVYTIGIFDEDKTFADTRERGARALKQLATTTGGVDYLPRSLRELDGISQKISRDVRTQFTLTYKPSVPWSEAGYRQIRVRVKAHGYKKLVARTRNGYVANLDTADGR